MKKTLIAVAALSAMAASAMASNVTVYGVVDTGLQYQHVKGEVSALGESASESTNKFAMTAGQNSGSRIGFKGIEDFGNGAKKLALSLKMDLIPMMENSVRGDASSVVKPIFM